MRQAPTLNAETTVELDNPDFREHQVTILISGTPPAGSEIALERKVPGSTQFLPVTVDDIPVVFTPDSLENDTVLISMQVSELNFVPNATFTGGAGSYFGYKITSWRS